MTPGNLYTASLVALSLLIALAVSWPAFLIVAALWLLIALALMWSERGELQRLATEANALAAQAVAQAETFADECKATQAANEILCVELACSDEIIHRLQNDALAAQMAASDADVIPLPVRDGAEPRWPEIARHIEHDDLSALIRATEEK